MLWFLRSHSRYWVKVTDIGLEGQFQGHKMRITWGNARFFSIDGVIDSTRPHLYTLLGEQGGIIWLQLPTENLARLYQPILPFDQYQQQSALLLQIIIAQSSRDRSRVFRVVEDGNGLAKKSQSGVLRRRGR